MTFVNLGNRCSKVWRRGGVVYGHCRRMARPGYRRCEHHAGIDRRSWQRASRYLVEIKGRCRTCRGEKENPFRTNCDRCRREAVERAGRAAHEHLAARLCKCGNPRAPGAGKRCVKCKDRDDRRNAAVSAARARKREQKAIYRQKRAAGICTQAGCNEPAADRSLCLAHQTGHAARERKSYAKRKGKLKAGTALEDLF